MRVRRRPARRRPAGWAAPRDRDAAARAGATIAVGGGLALATLNLSGQSGVERAPVAVWLGAVFLLALAAAARWCSGWLPALFWPVLPSVGVVLIVTLDLLTRDASAGGQIWFCWPVLYAAYLLRRPMAWLVCVQVVAGEAALTLLLSPRAEAVGNMLSFAFTMVVVTATLAAARDRIEAMVERLARLADYDELTGLVNRRVFTDRAGVCLTAPSGGPPIVSLLLIDLDEFKEVNDVHGHGVGDRALERVADLLRDHCRPQDVVGRLGGDELAMLLPGCPQEQAVGVAERLCTAVAATRVGVTGGSRLHLTVSIGVASIPAESSARTGPLLEAADRALYAAKRAGRNRVTCASATVDTGVTHASHVAAPGSAAS